MIGVRAAAVALIVFFGGAAANAQTPQSGSTDAYRQGVADWQALQGWVVSQTGDRRAGVDYWASNRNVAGHLSCEAAANNYSRSEAAFFGGCQDAKARLDPVDVRRLSEPQYRAGFNDEAKRLPILEGSPAGTATAAPPKQGYGGYVQNADPGHSTERQLAVPPEANDAGLSQGAWIPIGNIIFAFGKTPVEAQPPFWVHDRRIVIWARGAVPPGHGPPWLTALYFIDCENSLNSILVGLPLGDTKVARGSLADKVTAKLASLKNNGSDDLVAIEQRLIASQQLHPIQRATIPDIVAQTTCPLFGQYKSME